MKKLEIYKWDENYDKVEIVTLIDKFGLIGDENIEALRILNEADNEMFITVKFGDQSVTLRKGDILYMVQSDVEPSV